MNNNLEFFLDVETTGLSLEKDRIIELGIVKCKRGVVFDTLHIYFKVDQTINEESLAIHGINNQFLADKKYFSDHVDHIINFLDKNSTIYMHNADFDTKFMSKELERVQKGSLHDYCNKIVDTLSLARGTYKGSHSLKALCKKFKVYYPDLKHSAIIDAQCLAQVYRNLITTVTDKPLDIPKRKEKTDLFLLNITSYKTNININLLEQVNDLEHQKFLDYMQKKSGVVPLWKKLKKK